jgi:hypothetical protein
MPVSQKRYSIRCAIENCTINILKGCDRVLLQREKGASTPTKRTALDARILADGLLRIREDRTLFHLYVVNHRYKLTALELSYHLINPFANALRQ